MPTFSVQNYTGLDPTIKRTSFEQGTPAVEAKEDTHVPFQVETSKSVSEYMALALYNKFLKEKAEEQITNDSPVPTETIGVIAKEDINRYPGETRLLLERCKNVIIIVKEGAFTTAAESQFFDLSDRKGVKVYPSIDLFIADRRKHAS